MRSAVYAGTFDPITLGHLSVITRACELFERLYVLIAINPQKQPLFTLPQRLDFIREATAHLPPVEVAAFEGYVVHFARANGATVLVRGVRGATDADYESALAVANLELAPEIQTIFLPAHPELSNVSSSHLKALAAAGGDIRPYCTDAVARALETLYPSQSLSIR